MSERKEFSWPTAARDFHGADLSGLVFRDVHIDGTEAPVSFHRADLRRTEFEGAQLIAVDLSRSDFLDSVVSRSTFAKCKLDHFGMQSTTLRDAGLFDCHGLSAEFSDSRFIHSTVRGGAFTGGTFLGCVFEECMITNVGLERTTIENNHFYRTRLSDLDLGNQSLLHCTFSACTFERVILDVDVISTCTGFTMEEIRGLPVTRRGRRLDDPIDVVVADLYRRHVERDDVVEACNVAILARRRDWFEESILKLDRLLGPEVGARTLQLVRLARKLLYWHAEKKVDSYWVAWACNAIVDKARDPRTGFAPDHHVIEAVTLLMPVVEEYARASVAAVAHELSGHRLLDVVHAEITVDGAWSVDQARQLLDELNAYASPRVPRVLQVAGGIMHFKFARARPGSIIIEGAMVLAGLALLKIFLQQSRAVVEAAGRLFVTVGNTSQDWRDMRARLRDEPPQQAASAYALAAGDAPPRTDHATGGALALAPSSGSVEAAANQELLVRVVTRNLVPPSHRQRIAEHVLRVEIVQKEITHDKETPPL